MRDLRIDKAKGVLIGFVVLGHLLESVKGWETPLLATSLTAIYLFHMPAFVFLAGATTKRPVATRRFAFLVVLLVGFQLLYTVPVLLKSGHYPDRALQPHWILWFLLSLVWWLLLLTLVLRRESRPFAILVSVVIALGSGALPFVGYSLSLSRTAVFFPFFVTGHLWGRKLSEVRLSAPWKAVCCAILVALGLWVGTSGVEKEWLYGSWNYSDLGVSLALGLATRAIFLCVSASAVVMFLLLFGPSDDVSAFVGRSSLSVYVLHGFVVILLGKPLVWVMTRVGAPAVLIVAILLSFAIARLLAAQQFDSAIRRIVSGVVDRLMGADASPAARGQGTQ